MIKTFTPVYDLFRIDNTAIDPSEIDRIEVNRFISATGWTLFANLAHGEIMTDDIPGGLSYEYTFQVFLTDGTSSTVYETGPVSVPLSSPKPLSDVIVS